MAGYFRYQWPDDPGICTSLSNVKFSPRDKHVGPRLSLADFKSDGYGVNRRYRGLPVKEEAVDKCQGAEEGQKRLRYANLKRTLGSVGGILLRDKIIYFTVFSFLLLPLGTLGLFWVFEYRP